MPASPIGGMSTVKIFVLYLMRNINYPLSFVTINDIVMQNDYRSAKNMYGEETPIFNGNVGYIKKINPMEMVINLTEQGDLVLPSKAWPTLSLGYAITVHKKQGAHRLWFQCDPPHPP